jgi:gas vesicle protein
MDDDRSGGGAAGVVLSFVVGGLTGAALAILFAPRSGKETRELLGEKLREGAERGRDLKERVVARGRHLADEAGEYVDRQREVLKESRDRLAAAVEAGRETYRGEKKERS